MDNPLTEKEYQRARKNLFRWYERLHHKYLYKLQSAAMLAALDHEYHDKQARLAHLRYEVKC